VVVEVDGRANHSSKVDWEHDLTRRNRITAQGYAVIHATRDRAKNHPEEFLAEVQRARAGQARLRGRRAGWPA
jgi:very-short-patch-repair endonuclease